MMRRTMTWVGQTMSRASLLQLVLVAGLVGPSIAAAATPGHRDPGAAASAASHDGTNAPREAVASASAEPVAAPESKLALSAAIPGIWTWVMMLSGVGLVGLVIRRRGLVIEGAAGHRTTRAS